MITQQTDPIRQSYPAPVPSIRKGNAIAGRSKQAASIPSKFETFLNVGDKEKHGFGGRTYRFDMAESEVPGPGQYISKVDFERTGGSVSKKGYGNGFISKTKRWYEMPRSTFNSPGPGNYRPPDFITVLDEKPTSYMGNTANFAGPTRRSSTTSPLRAARAHTAPVTMTPGPGAYDPGVLEGAHSVSDKTNAVFRSSSTRLPEEKLTYKYTPGPGQYDPDEKVHHKVLHDETIPTWEFRSKSTRRVMSASTLRELPGPGAYDPKKPGGDLLKAVPPSSPSGVIHKRAPVADPLHDDRGPPSVSEIQQAALLHKLDTPGPGTYEIDRYEVSKIPVTASVFVSKTERITKDFEKVKPPGPAFYTADLPSPKKSFNLNSSNRFM